MKSFRFSHISGEDSVPQVQAFSQMSLPQVESTAKKIQRGTNFSIQEDNLLVFAFLNVNQDVVQSTIGASRGGGVYLSRVDQGEEEKMELLPRLGLGPINIAPFMEFRYGDEKVLDTQPYLTRRLASTHCILHLNLIKGTFNIVILDSHTH